MKPIRSGPLAPMDSPAMKQKHKNPLSLSLSAGSNPEQQGP